MFTFERSVLHRIHSLWVTLQLYSELGIFILVENILSKQDRISIKAGVDACVP